MKKANYKPKRLIDKYSRKYKNYLDSLDRVDRLEKPLTSWLQHYLKKSVFVRTSYILRILEKGSKSNFYPLMLIDAICYFWLLFFSSFKSLLLIKEAIFSISYSQKSRLQEIYSKKNSIILFDEEIDSYSIFAIEKRQDVDTEYKFKNYVIDILRLYEKYEDIYISSYGKVIKVKYKHNDFLIEKVFNCKKFIFFELMSFKRLIKTLFGFVTELIQVVMSSKSIYSICSLDLLLKSHLRKSLNLPYQILITNASQEASFWELSSPNTSNTVNLIMYSLNIHYKTSKIQPYCIYCLRRTKYLITNWTILDKASKGLILSEAFPKARDKCSFKIISSFSYNNEKIQRSSNQNISRSVIVFDIPIKDLFFCYKEWNVFDKFEYKSDWDNVQSNDLIEFWNDLLELRSIEKIYWKQKSKDINSLDSKYLELTKHILQSSKVVEIDSKYSPLSIARSFPKIPIISFPLSSAIHPSNIYFKNRCCFYSPINFYSRHNNLSSIQTLPLLLGRNQLDIWLHKFECFN